MSETPVTKTPPTKKKRELAVFGAKVWVDTAVLTVLAAIGILGFATSFGDPSYLLAGLGGLIIGTAFALLAAWLRLDAIITVAVVIGAYFVFGSALAMPERALLGFLPNLETLAGLATGAVFGWADIVTLSAPVAAPDYISVLPYVVGWLVGVISATLAARWFVRTRRTAIRSGIALLAPTAVYITGVLMGTAEPYLASVRGIAFAVIALVWMAWRVAPGENMSLSAKNGVLRQKLLGTVAIALVAIIGGGLLGVVAAPPEEQRFVLRENVEPPFDPLQYSSPLSGFRKYTKDLTDEVLMTVEGLEPGDQIRMATMDSYDGKLWNVTGPELAADGSGSFRLVGREVPVADFLTKDGSITLDVTIDQYGDVWLPGAGYPRDIDFPESAGVASTALRYNAATGIAVVTSGVRSGMTYEIVADRQEFPSDEALQTTPVARIDLPPVANVPDIVASKATEYAGDAATPIEQLRAMEQSLRSLGFLSHGTASESIPSSAGHGADRMKALFERNQMIGDEEQYASAFALMARHLGYPARVVMGFAPEVPEDAGSIEVTGDDVSAWVEVAFEGVGWLPFYPTPDETDIPQDQTPKPKTEPQPQVRQPPRSDTEQDDLVSAVELEDSNDDEEAGFQIPGWVWGVAAGILIPLLLYFVPLLIVGAIKARRRRKRRTAGPVDRRAAGAWDELVDTYAELGYAASRRATRVQLALSFEQQFREELEARQGERTGAADRAQSKLARAEAKAADKAAAKTAATEAKNVTAENLRQSSIADETVMRVRDAAAWRPGVANDAVPLPAIPGLREFAVRADEAVFSGDTVDDERLDALWKESESASAAAEGSVSWLRRRLSRFRIRSKTDLAERLAARVSAAVPTTTLGATNR